MVLSFKVVLGWMFWGIAVYACGLGIALIAFLATQKKTPKKPKYEGQPIVIKGGRKDAK